jgi:uroporphyrinogen III methyltransferase/synthase
MKAQVAGASKITKVAITRSRRGNAELARSLRALGFEPIQIDTIEFLPPADWSAVDSSLRDLGRFAWLLFTSATGAEFFAKRMEALGLAVPWEGKPAVAAVGEKTSAALQRQGVKVDFVPTRYLTEALAEQLPEGRGTKVLMLRADISDPKAVTTLERNGFLVTDLAIYRTSSIRSGEDLPVGQAVRDADAIVFASPSAVEAFIGRLDPSELASLAGRILAVCIGPVTAATARQRGFERILTPKTHTIEGVVQELGAAAPGEGR